MGDGMSNAVSKNLETKHDSTPAESVDYKKAYIASIVVVLLTFATLMAITNFYAVPKYHVASFHTYMFTALLNEEVHTATITSQLVVPSEYNCEIRLSKCDSDQLQLIVVRSGEPLVYELLVPYRYPHDSSLGYGDITLADIGSDVRSDSLVLKVVKSSRNGGLQYRFSNTTLSPLKK